jgi:DNA polymerase
VKASEVRTALARHLTQRLDLDPPPLILESLPPEVALEILRARPDDRDTAPKAPSASPSSSPASSPSPPESEAVQSTTEGRTDLEVLRSRVAGCTLCGLHETRTQTVFSDGQENARIMVVGEAPGANEDRTGLPFVGQAGKLLDLLLASVGLSRAESVYICNVLKCRPPGNRNPTSDEIQLCSPYLKSQIELVAPEVILAVGTFSAQLLTGQKSPLSKLRGAVHSYQGVPMLVTYHPAALLRNSGWTRATWDDLQLLRDVLNGADG